METRVRDMAGEAKDRVRETAQEIAARTKAAGSAALESAHAAYNVASTKAVEGARATDMVIRENPYRTIGVAFGLGLIIGILVNRR